MKGYNYKAVSHPFEEDLSQIVNDWSVTKPTSPFPLADDGYLYVYVMGQSNQTGGTSGDQALGFMDEITDVYIPDGLGGWKLAEWYVSPLQPGARSPGILACHLLTKKYGIKVRAIYNASGSKQISDWAGTGVMITQLEATYNLLGTDWRPCELWLQAQGETGYFYDYATYYPDWNDLRQRMLNEGWLSPNHVWYAMEIAQANFLSNAQKNNTNLALQQIASENTGYRFTRMDGEEQADKLHFYGRSIINLARKWVRFYEEQIFGITPKLETERPSATTITVGTITATTVDLSWTAVTPISGRTIVGYAIYRNNGGLFWRKFDSTTLSATVPFFKGSGETESFQVLAVDDLGQYTFWLTPSTWTEVLIP